MILRDKGGRFKKGSHPKSEFKKGIIPWSAGKKLGKAWNSGKTVIEDPRIAHGVPWNKGLTKEIDERVARFSETRKRLFSEGKLVPPILGRKGKLAPMYGMKGILSPRFGKRPSYPKPKFIESLGHAVRSDWESAVCSFLKKNNQGYGYECTRLYGFINKRQLSWLVDLTLDDGILIEVKGYLRDVRGYSLIGRQNKAQRIVFVVDKRFTKKALKVTPFVVSFDEFKRTLLPMLEGIRRTG